LVPTLKNITLKEREETARAYITNLGSDYKRYHLFTMVRFTGKTDLSF